VLRVAGEIDYAPFLCWAHLLQATIAERRDDLPRAAHACDDALAAAQVLGLPHFIAFTLIQTGRVAARRGDMARAVAVLHDAIDIADAAGTPWFAALGRVALADVCNRKGDSEGGTALLQAVLEWGEQAHAAAVRGYFFLAVGGDPIALARTATT
jgi:ATP/maltotriose-dependent transcriptional regulator MalT